MGRLQSLLELIGLDIVKFFGLKNYARYRADLRNFQSKGGVTTQKRPILVDFDSQSGVASGHYFHQDLLVASLIFEGNPKKHTDVGSRIDGFVAHVASFRKIEVIDIRPLENLSHSNIHFNQLDIMKQSHLVTTDSLSCLHTLEHFGLGRYGDPIDPDGHIKGFANLLTMLEPAGVLYVSFPIGMKSQVIFNAHRIFHPLDILNWSDVPIEIIRFDYVDDSGDLHKQVNLFENTPILEYGCGIYTIRKK